MAEEWFKQKERAAGVKRLLLSWFVYKHFGVFPLRMIAFFAVLLSYPSLKTQNRALNTILSCFSNIRATKNTNLLFLTFLNFCLIMRILLSIKFDVFRVKI